MTLLLDRAPTQIPPDRRPLVVDLDGALVKTDMLVETALSALGSKPQNILHLLAALGGGKAELKARAASLSQFDAALLPYNEAVVAIIRGAREAGRPIYLASACDKAVAEAVAAHLGLFDGVFSSNGAVNLAGTAKAERLVEAFGESNFEYIGNDWVDLAVWRRACGCIAVTGSPRLERELRRMDPSAISLPHEAATLGDWLRLLRVHQYTKNLLIFAPLVAAHAFTARSIEHAILGFVAFSLCASGVYLLNDLFDVQADRAHSTKRRRALAAGRIPLLHGLFAGPLLLGTGLGLGAMTSMPFLGVIATYVAITMLYTFWLKQKLLVDVVVLALLYVVRVVAGAAAIGAPISHWFLGFALFIFTCLALVKRYVECAAAPSGGLRKRAYLGQDASVLLLLAAASGFNAVTVLALYIASNDVGHLYASPEWLWMLCPVMMYWMSRLIVLAQRGQVHDDPIVFALKDRASLLTLGALGVVVGLATSG
ncbi:MAG: UbiA family prenyltransferase [Caulobacteraceae bacterium]|nr:UbiA family prenyltransferase [Caulobacteraceae bacterium]